jgi:hypothetical protein
MPAKNKFLIPAGAFLAIILYHSVYRDIHLEKQYPGDLRNRVVGARLQKDGILPYFYHWNLDTVPGHQVSRYMDPGNYIIHKGVESNITSSPFFHEMLFPICDLPQRTISRIWMWLEYLFLAGMIWMICRLTPDNSKKLLLISTGILFTTTEAWKSLIQTGQFYFLIAFLMSCVIAGLMRQRKSGIWLSGICTVLMILIKPTALVILIPFMLRPKKHILFLAVAFSGLAIYGVFVLLSPFQNRVWKDYARALSKHIEAHQNSDDPKIPLTTKPRFIRLEGFDFAKVRQDSVENPIPVYSENGNVFVIYRHLTNTKMPLRALYALTLLTVAALTGIFYYRTGKYKQHLLQSLLFAFILYMLVEAFSPIYRHQYYSTQWLPLILAGLLPIRSWRSPVFILLMLGLFLNILNTVLIPMRHTLGEMCWLAGLLLIAFSVRPTVNKIQWKQLS